ECGVQRQRDEQLHPTGRQPKNPTNFLGRECLDVLCRDVYDQFSAADISWLTLQCPILVVKLDPLPQHLQSSATTLGTEISLANESGQVEPISCQDLFRDFGKTTV